MAKEVNQQDQQIVLMLQQKGFIKSEARDILKREVYQLQPHEITKIKRYSSHFGLSAKEKLIDEILDLRREVLIGKLNAPEQAQELHSVV